MSDTDPLAHDMRRRIASVLDGTSLTENDEVIDALTTSTLHAIPKAGHANPLARERFRTILMGPIEAEADRVWKDGPASFDEGSIVETLASLFPDAHFEHCTNDAGVRVRRVVVASDWEVDPAAAVKNMQEPCDTCSDMGCAECQPLVVDGDSIRPGRDSGTPGFRSWNGAF
jgi:hypothetical protein